MESYVFMEKTQPWPFWWLLAVCAAVDSAVIGLTDELNFQLKENGVIQLRLIVTGFSDGN